MIDKILDVIVIITSIGGSTLIASNIGLNQLGYILFVVSSIITIKQILESNIRRSQLILWIYFLAMNIWGVIRY